MSHESEHTLIVKGQPIAQPPLLDVTNHLSSEVHTFKGRSRKDIVVSEVIIHESVTRSVESTVSVLAKRGLGVHLMVAPDGHVTQHADLADVRLAHGSPHNTRSVAIEVVNPYKPRFLKPGAPWTRVIDDAPWAHKKAYVVPTPEQAEAVAALVRWITSPCAVGLSIPRHWIGLRDGHLAMSKVDGATKRRPGVYAHHYFAHADGAWLILYAILRIEAGLNPCEAYEQAVRRATGVRRRVDLRDVISLD